MSVSAARARDRRATDSEALRVALPDDLRNVMMRDLPENIRLSPGGVEIPLVRHAHAGELCGLPQAMQNNLEQVRLAFEPLPFPPRLPMSNFSVIRRTAGSSLTL